MRTSVNRLISAVLCGVVVLLVGTPRIAFGQDEPVAVKLVLDYRAGEDVPVRRLGEFLRDAFSLDVGGRGGEPLEVTLTIETFSREGGTGGKQESRPVALRVGTKTSGSALIPLIDEWIPQIDEWIPQREGRMVLGRTAPSRGGSGMPRECEDDSHAIRFTLNSVGERGFIDAPMGNDICMTWRP